MRLSRIALVLLLLSAFGSRGAAQQGLVLSGGGSRGLAHAGALLELESLGYEPDIVVGTSMGALLGALYAAGYTPEEIVAQLETVSWGKMFIAAPLVVGPDRIVRYPAVSFDLNVEPLRFNRGIFPQWRINRTLAGLLFDANARSRGDFDRLARRYRAVAADLRTGERVVLATGDLARAARASMAVPGIFAPVLWENDRVLIDGAIADNLPVSVARGLGARHVIAVDVSRPPEEIHARGPLDVAGRALDLMQDNAQRDSARADALVVPRLPPGSHGTSFPDDPAPLFRLGHEAVRRDLPPAPPGTRAMPRPLALPPESFSGLVVEAADPALEALGREAFRDVAPGPYDPAAVRAAMDRLFSTGLFEAVWPRVESDGPAGGAVLHVRLDAPPVVSLSAGVGYENDRGARVWTALQRNSTLLARPATLTAAVSHTGVERWAALSARIFLLADPSLSWTLGAHALERDVRTFGETGIATRDVVRVGGSASLELPYILRDWLSALTGRAEWIHAEDGPRGVSAGPLLQLTALEAEPPLVGAVTSAEAEARWGEIAYRRVAITGSARTSARRLLLAGVADLALASSGTPEDVLPALGDGRAVPGLRWGEERGAGTIVVGADAAYPLARGHLRLRLRTGAVSPAWGRWSAAERVSGVEVAGIWRTSAGPFEVGFGLNDRGDRRVDVTFGRAF